MWGGLVRVAISCPYARALVASVSCVVIRCLVFRSNYYMMATTNATRVNLMGGIFPMVPVVPLVPLVVREDTFNKEGVSIPIFRNVWRLARGIGRVVIKRNQCRRFSMFFICNVPIGTFYLRGAVLFIGSLPWLLRIACKVVNMLFFPSTANRHQRTTSWWGWLCGLVFRSSCLSLFRVSALGLSFSWWTLASRNEKTIPFLFQVQCESFAGPAVGA